MKTASATTSTNGKSSEIDQMWARRILTECREGKRDRGSEEVLSAVATLGLPAAVEFFTGEPLNSPKNAAKVRRLPLGRRLVRELDGAGRL
jgi:hypothetical protein